MLEEREMGRYLRAWFYISSQFSTKYLIENIFESTTNVMMFLSDPSLKFRGMNIHFECMYLLVLQKFNLNVKYSAQIECNPM